MMEHMQDIIDYLKDFMKEKGFPPSARQIADELKLDYEEIVKPAMEKLVEEGKIVIDKAKDRVIEILE